MLLNAVFNNILLEVQTGEVAEKAEEARAFFNKENMTGMITQFADTVVSKVIDIIIALVIWKLSKYLIRWILKITVKALEKAGFDVGVIKFISSFIKAGVYAVVMLIILDLLGFQTASLIAVFGSAALALSMSLQGSLSNMAGGILILLFKPFVVGDYIVSGSCEGTVVSIDILYTKLRMIDNKMVMMPNGALANSNIINVGADSFHCSFNPSCCSCLHLVLSCSFHFIYYVLVSTFFLPLFSVML